MEFGVGPSIVAPRSIPLLTGYYDARPDPVTLMDNPAQPLSLATVDSTALPSASANGSTRRVGGRPRLCTVNPTRPGMRGATPPRFRAQGAHP